MVVVVVVGVVGLVVVVVRVVVGLVAVAGAVVEAYETRGLTIHCLRIFWPFCKNSLKFVFFGRDPHK